MTKEQNQDRERIAAILQLRHPGNMYSTCERDADAILAAGFSRATVPDAATEVHPLPENGCDQKAHDTLNRNLRRVFELNSGLLNELEVVKDERDAALAAIERVRAEASGVIMAETDPPNDWNQALDYLAKQILAALDGAPEPEVKP